MLANLLPGAREIRTPLTVGYAWLLVFWLSFGHRLPQQDQAHGALADVYRLARAVGPIPVGVAVSVAAYVLGVIATRIGFVVAYAIGDLIRRTPLGPATPGDRRGNLRTRRLWWVAFDRVAQRLASDGRLRAGMLDWLQTNEPGEFGGLPREDLERAMVQNSGTRRRAVALAIDVDKVVGELVENFSEVVERVRSGGGDRVLEYDRLIAEGEFRVAVFSPLAALCVVLALRWTPLFLVGIPFLSVLIYLGVAMYGDAEAEISGLLLIGKVEDPELARIDTMEIPFRSVDPDQNQDHQS